MPDRMLIWAESMSSAKKTALLIDGNAMIHRAWHALPPMTGPDGEATSAVYGFASILLKLLPSVHPDYLAVCWDTEAPTYRHEANAAYKAQRVEQPQEFYDQFDGAKEMVEIFGGVNLEKDGYEADDLIATLATRLSKHGVEVAILSSDRDLWQLISPHVHILSFVKGVSETVRLDAAGMKDATGLEPDQWADFKALRGDASDNLKGVAGIGEKTATDLLQRFGTLERVLKAAHDPKSEMAAGVRAKLVAGEKDAHDTRHLVGLVCDAPVDEKSESYLRRTVDEEAVKEAFRKFGFTSLVARLEKGSSAKSEGKKTRTAPPKTEKAEASMAVSSAASLPSRTIASVAEAESALKRLADAAEVAVRISKPLQGSLLAETEGLAFCDGEETVFIPETFLSKGALSKLAKELFEASAPLKHAHGLKLLCHWGMARGWVLGGLGLDTEIAAHLVSAGEGKYPLENLAAAKLGLALPEGESKPLLEAEAVWRLKGILAKELEVDRLDPVYEKIEKPIIPVIARMETEGILIDRAYFKKIATEFRAEKERVEKEMQEMAGVSFNPASPAQLANVLFETLKIPSKGLKRGKTGVSTAASEMEKIEGLHPIVAKVGEYREVAKLLSTYVEVLPDLADAEGRIHTTFNQIGAATGRLSSTDPNLQNIPIRTELGRKIRRGFIARKGYVLLSCDYSQIELRIVAALAKDGNMLESFNRGEDIHAATAAKIWNIPLSAVAPEQRRAAKAINFGILYGQGPVALAKSTGLPFAEAKEFIKKYFTVYSGIHAYLDHLKQFAATEGYVETLFGRRRPVPEIESPIPQLRAAAERIAMNMPIQGTEADFVKMAMFEVDRDLPKISAGSRLLLQVHDELVFEVPESEVETVARAMSETMASVAKIGCPIVVEAKSGRNWADEERLKL